MTRKVYIVGVGVTKFCEVNTGGDYPEYAKTAILDALTDAGIMYEDVEQAVCCFVSGSGTYGQRILYQVGMTSIPIHNVNNSCASGSTGLFMGKQLVEGNIASVVLVLGFEKMQIEQSKSEGRPRANALDKHAKMVGNDTKMDARTMLWRIYGNAGFEYMRRSDITKLHIAKVAAKNYRHGAKNPKAQSGVVYNIDEILRSRKVHGPLTKLECCPLSDGASAAILMSEEAVIKYGLQTTAVEIVGMEMVTDTDGLFKTKSSMPLAGYDMTVLAARKLYEKTGVSPMDIDVVELHDSCAVNEIMSYEALRLCGVVKAGKFIDDGDNTYGGRVVINPSGGLIARGHPLGATGVAQCAELVLQLRGDAGDRQVQNAKLALQHNQGVGGATVVAIYRKGFSNVGS